MLKNLDNCPWSPVLRFSSLDLYGVHVQNVNFWGGLVGLVFCYWKKRSWRKKQILAHVLHLPPWRPPRSHIQPLLVTTPSRSEVRDYVQVSRSFTRFRKATVLFGGHLILLWRKRTSKRLWTKTIARGVNARGQTVGRIPDNKISSHFCRGL